MSTYGGGNEYELDLNMNGANEHKGIGFRVLPDASVHWGAMYAGMYAQDVADPDYSYIVEMTQLYEKKYIFYPAAAILVNNLLAGCVNNTSPNMLYDVFAIRAFCYDALNPNLSYDTPYGNDYGQINPSDISVYPFSGLTEKDHDELFRFSKVKIATYTNWKTKSLQNAHTKPGKCPQANLLELVQGWVYDNIRQHKYENNFIAYKGSNHSSRGRGARNLLGSLVFIQSPLIMPEENGTASQHIIGVGEVSCINWGSDEHGWYRRIDYQNIGYFKITDVWLDVNLLHLNRKYEFVCFSNVKSICEIEGPTQGNVCISYKPLELLPKRYTYEKIHCNTSAKQIINKKRIAGIREDSTRISFYDTLRRNEKQIPDFNVSIMSESTIQIEQREIRLFDIDCNICIMFIRNTGASTSRWNEMSGEVISYDIFDHKILWTVPMSHLTKPGNSIEISGDNTSFIFHYGPNPEASIRVHDITDGSYIKTYNYTQLFVGWRYSYSRYCLQTFSGTNYFMFLDVNGNAIICRFDTGEYIMSIPSVNHYYYRRDSIYIYKDILYTVDGTNLTIKSYDLLHSGNLLREHEYEGFSANEYTLTISGWMHYVLVSFDDKLNSGYYIVDMSGVTSQYSIMYNDVNLISSEFGTGGGGGTSAGRIKVNLNGVGITERTTVLRDTGERVHDTLDVHNWQQSIMYFGSRGLPKSGELPADKYELAFSPATLHTGGASNFPILDSETDMNICLAKDYIFTEMIGVGDVEADGLSETREWSCDEMLYWKLRSMVNAPVVQPPEPVTPDKPLTICEQHLYDRMDDMINVPTPCDCTPIQSSQSEIRVYIDEKYIAIGLFLDSTGKVEVYDARTREKLYTILPPSNISGFDYFGEAMNIIDNKLYVYAFFDSTGYIFIYSMDNGAYLHAIQQPYVGEASKFGYGIADLGNGIVGFADQQANREPRYSYDSKSEYLSIQNQNNFETNIEGGVEVPRVAQEKNLMMFGINKYPDSGIGIYKYSGVIDDELVEEYTIYYNYASFVTQMIAINLHNMFFATYDGRIVKTNISSTPSVEIETSISYTPKWIVANNKYVCVSATTYSQLDYIYIYNTSNLQQIGKVKIMWTRAKQNFMYIQKGEGNLFIAGIRFDGIIPIYDLSTTPDNDGVFKSDDRLPNLCYH